MLTRGTAATSVYYHAVCRADNARATKPEVALNDGFSLGLSAEWGTVGSVMHRGLSNISVFALLLALVYGVLLPSRLAGSQTQGQEPSPGRQCTLQPFLAPPTPLPPACGIWELSYKSQQKKARWFLAQPVWGNKQASNKKTKPTNKENKQTNKKSPPHTHKNTNQTNLTTNQPEKRKKKQTRNYLPYKKLKLSQLVLPSSQPQLTPAGSFLVTNITNTAVDLPRARNGRLCLSHASFTGQHSPWL